MIQACLHDTGKRRPTGPGSRNALPRRHTPVFCQPNCLIAAKSRRHWFGNV